MLLVTGLTTTSLWADEGWTIAATAESNPIDIITQWVAVDVHPPLFFLGLNIWRRFTGDTIFEMRYYSVLLSMLGVALAYRLGQGLYTDFKAKHELPLHHHSNRVGLLTALFYALHDRVNVLTQEVRHYPQQMMMVVLAIWLYWRFWRQPSRKRGIIFMIAGAALIYTHYWGGFILLSMVLHTLITQRQRLRPFVWIFIGIGLLFTPWLPVLYHQITLERPGGLPHALENTQYVYAVLIFQLVGIPELFWIILAVIGTFGLPLRRRPSNASLLLFLAAILTPTLSILLNTAYPTLSFRSLAVIIPPVIVLAAHGLTQFRPREQYVMIAFIVLHSLFSTSAGPVVRAPWPDVAKYLATHTTSEDVILLELDTDVHSTVYYLNQIDPTINYAYTEEMRELHANEYPAYLNDALEGHSGAWVAKLGWPLIDGDIRPELVPFGFVETMPEITTYGMHIERPILLWRLDRAVQPDDTARAVFDDLLNLHSADATARPDHVTVNLLWSSSQVPERDYTISAFLLGADGTFANQDSYPLSGPTSQWEKDNLYFDSHNIDTQTLPPGSYQVGVQVYTFTDASFTTIENSSVADCTDDSDCRFIIIADVQVR